MNEKKWLVLTFILLTLFYFAPFPLDYFVIFTLIVITLVKVSKVNISRSKIKTIFLLIACYLILLTTEVLKFNLYKDVFGFVTVFIIVILPSLVIIIPMVISHKVNSEAANNMEEKNKEIFMRERDESSIKKINNIVWSILFIVSVVILFIALI